MGVIGLNNAILLIGALVLIVVGAIACFAGYRVFRTLLALQGFVAGVIIWLALANGLTLAPGQETLVRLIFALVGGLIGASLAMFLYTVAVFLSGAALGILIANSLAINSGEVTRLVLIVLLALAGGIVALVFQKLFIVISTSFVGALLIVSGLYRLLGGREMGGNLLMDPGLLLVPGASQSLGTLYFLLLLAGVVLTVAGFLVQYRIIHESGHG